MEDNDKDDDNNKDDKNDKGISSLGPPQKAHCAITKIVQKSPVGGDLISIESIL